MRYCYYRSLNHSLATVYRLGNMGYHGGVVAISIICSLFAFISISQDVFDFLFCSSIHYLCRFFNIHWLIALSILSFILIHLILLHSLSSLLSILPHWMIISISILISILSFLYSLIKDLFSLTLIPLYLSISIIIIDLWDFGNCDNNDPADPLSTPPEIIPEWYFLIWFGLLKSFPILLLGLFFLILIIILILLISSNPSSISYSLSNIDHHHHSSISLILLNWFRAYWILGLIILLLVLLFPLSSLSISSFSISIQRLLISSFILVL